MNNHCPECDYTHPAEECGRYKIGSARWRDMDPFKKSWIIVYDTKEKLYTAVTFMEYAESIVAHPEKRLIWNALPKGWEFVDWELRDELSRV